MSGKTVFAIVAFLLLGVFVATAETGEKAKEEAALTAARNWLQLVDTGKYPESWKEAAEIFRNAVRQEQWTQAMQSLRQPLGGVISRKPKSRTYSTALPGAPKGEYVVIQFETSFAQKKTAVETVTPMLGTDGKWRVSGYFIK